LDVLNIFNLHPPSNALADSKAKLVNQFAHKMKEPGPICKCFMCNDIRKTLPNIDPDFTESSKDPYCEPEGLDHKALLARYDIDYPVYLKGMEAKMVHDLKAAGLQAKKTEMEIKQLELDIKKAQLQREKAELQIKKEA
jgi:hypothetical protein